MRCAAYRVRFGAERTAMTFPPGSRSKSSCASPTWRKNLSLALAKIGKLDCPVSCASRRPLFTATSSTVLDSNGYLPTWSSRIGGVQRDFQFRGRAIPVLVQNKACYQTAGIARKACDDSGDRGEKLVGRRRENGDRTLSRRLGKTMRNTVKTTRGKT